MSKIKVNYELISDKQKNAVTDAKYIKHGDDWLDVALAEAAAEVAKKANKTDVNNELNKKASTEYVNAELSKKADKTDVAAELVTKANKIDVETALAGKASTESLASTNEAVADLSTEQVTLSARMDEFTKLGEGSTTGDAELADIRVGADGKTYENAGAAVRGQVTNLKEDVSGVIDFKNGYPMSDPIIGVYTYSKSSGYMISSTQNDRVSGKIIIPVEEGMEIGLPDYSVYSYCIGTNGNGQPSGLWLYRTADFAVRPQDIDYVKLVLFKRNDGATMTEDDVNYLKENFVVGKNISNPVLRSGVVTAESLSNSALETAKDYSTEEVVQARVTNAGIVYSTLKERLDTKELELKTDISNTNELIYKGKIYVDFKENPYKLENGAYQGNNGAKINNPARIRTNTSKKFNVGAIIRCKEGWELSPRGYTEPDVFNESTYIKDYDKGAAYVNEIVIDGTKGNHYISLTFRNSEGSDISASDYTIDDIITVDGRIEAEIPSIKAIDANSHNSFVHLSFDDVEICLRNLASNPFESVWDEPFFAMLKALHDKYDAIFSLYVWKATALADISDMYAAEFKEASNWLKFGFHATGSGSMETTSYQDAKNQYNAFIHDIFRICGGVNSVDRIPRLNYFAGSLEACKGLRDADCGCIGFLGADDNRSAYYLDESQLIYLRSRSILTDVTNGLHFMSTVMRLDWFVSGFSSSYEYNTPVYDNPYDELVYRYGKQENADQYANLIVFTHEWQTYSGSYVLNADMVNSLDQVCRFAKDYKYKYDYPQNRLQDIRSYAF